MKLARMFLTVTTLTLQISCDADEPNATFSTNSILSHVEQMQALRKEADDAESAYLRAVEERKPKDQTEKLWKTCRQVNDANYPKIFELAKQEPASETAGEMFGWIVMNPITEGGPLSSIGEQSVRFLRDFHTANPNIAKICRELGTPYWDPTFQPAMDFLQMAADKNPNYEVRGQAILALARRDMRNAGNIISYSENTSTNDPYFKKHETDYLERAKNQNPETLSRESERLFNLVLDEYANCPSLERTNSPLQTKGTLGEVARAELYELDHLSVGKMAPEIEGEDIFGKRLKLSDYRGQIVMLSFWASWCGPCMALVPSEVKLTERMKGKPFALVGINGDCIRDDARRAVEKEKMAWPSFWSPKGPDGPIPTAWNVLGWPTVYLLDTNGIIRLKIANINLINQKIDQLLGQFADKTPTQ